MESTFLRSTYKFFTFAVCLVLLACGNNKPDIFQTTSGFYGSKEGGFLVKFPLKPFVIVQENNIGDSKFDAVQFRYSEGIEHHYLVSYVDYPEQVLKLWDIENLFDKTAEAMGSEFGNFDIKHKQSFALTGLDKSVSYDLLPSNRGSSQAKLRLVKKDNRIYAIGFIALRRVPDREKIDAFINSFALLPDTK